MCRKDGKEKRRRKVKGVNERASRGWRGVGVVRNRRREQSQLSKFGAAKSDSS